MSGWDLLLAFVSEEISVSVLDRVLTEAALAAALARNGTLKANVANESLSLSVGTRFDRGLIARKYERWPSAA